MVGNRVVFGTSRGAAAFEAGVRDLHRTHALAGAGAMITPGCRRDARQP